MNFIEAEKYILGFTDYEKQPGVAYTQENYDLRRTEELLGLMGNPHLAAKSVHVAGTKGKGSTAAMIASVLCSSGQLTGLYSSPHFHTIRERIRVDGVMISELEFASATGDMLEAVEKVNRESHFGKLTTFEILTALALTYFKSKKVIYMVLEAGLGGRLDATNVVKPLVSVITSISLDHTDILGITPALIASEKAGIIKPETPVVLAPQFYSEVIEVVKEKCLQQKSHLTEVGLDLGYRVTHSNESGQEIEITGKLGRYLINIPLLGEYQSENAASAMAALEIIRDGDVGITEAAIGRGFEGLNWPGRLQILKKEPLLVVDGAHNGYSMKRLLKAVRDSFKYTEARVLFGSSLDKDITAMVEELANFNALITVTRSSHPRAAEIPVLSGIFTKKGIYVTAGSNVARDLEKLMSTAPGDSLVLVTGSLFVVGEAMEWAFKLLR